MGSDHCHSHTTHKTGPLWIVLILSSTYMVVEIAGAWLSGSLTLLADAAHMAIDTGAVALGLFASWIARRPPTPDKSFGYYRAEILAATLNGVLLLVIAGFIFTEAWPRFWNPPAIRGGLMTTVAVGGLIINLIALYITHGASKDSINVKGVWLHIMGDTLGSVGAIIASILIWQWGMYLADPILSCVLALLIVAGALKLLSECVHVLLEGVPKGVNAEKIREGLLSVQGVEGIHELHVWMLTSGFISLSAHIRASQGENTSQLLARLNTHLRDHHKITHSTLQIEPVDFQDRQSTVCH